MKYRNGFRQALVATGVAAVIVASSCGSTDDGQSGAATTAATATTAAAPSVAAAPTTVAAPSWPLTAPAASLPVTVTDANGVPVTVTSIDRIASLQGDISEILWTLGLNDRIAVVDTTAVYPDTLLKTKPNAGFFRTLSAEGLLAQRPTVVLAHPGAGPAEVLAALKSAGIPIVLIPEFNGTDLLEAGKKIRAVGAAVGLADHAAKLATQVDSDINKAITDAKAAAKTPPVAAYIVPRGQQVFLTGLDSPSNAIIEAAGGSPVAKLLKLDKATLLTPEALASVQPQFIVSTFTAVAQAGGDAAFLSIAGIAETPAAKNKKLLQFDDTLVQQLGPRTGQAVRELSKKFFA
ncbi:MAG: hemin ABC transporter substrate-binding protein [Acidimicrobiia bacterium]